MLCVKTRGWGLELGDAIRGSGAPQVGLTFEHHHHHVPEGLGMFPVP